MGRIVINKHFKTKSDITANSFKSDGELIISNQVGYEGIVIRNNNGDLFFITPTSGTGTDVPIEYKEYIESYVNDAFDTAFDGYLTSAETISLISASGATEEEMRAIAENVVSGAMVLYITSAMAETMIASALTDYATKEYVSEQIVSAMTGGEINLEGYATEEWVEKKGYLTEHQDISNLVTKDEAKEYAAEEVAKIVASADSSFDTLKEIADWILNDTTGAAAMANDIASLKTTVSEDNVNNWNNAEENAKAYASAYTDSALSQYATIQYVDDKISKISGTTVSSSDHVFLSATQYEELSVSGSVVVDGVEIVYNDSTYYAVYED